MLPASALEKLTMMHVQYPMMFKVTNPRGNRATHCGVMEFSAREGHCYLPQWVSDAGGERSRRGVCFAGCTLPPTPPYLSSLLTRLLHPVPSITLSPPCLQIMENLVLEEGALIVIRNVQLPKGRFVKFRPHSKDFLDISNPRAV